ncbi:beta-ketoacyl synthase chain length factor [Dyadobacter crusticola]|uniref:beta-ketoacyl synthase chain length factor n=1 Tax=Dyadobacter crusticola TaxID=292407 RepID=UPI0004E263A8|nr:beta-ketoacyl synthase chain length factor [Dyadobacter crusticola]
MDKRVHYISAASTISHQPTFGNAGFSGSISALQADTSLITPDFKAYIDAGLLRRMSKILRMSVACAKDCIAQAHIEQPDAIIVGTGLGCLQDTEKFLNTSLTVEGLLPPTSFIQSTHNTMAGQISLSISNHGYNMTHTQNTLSFEHALLDGILLLNDGESDILVGAADEYIDILSEIGRELNLRPARQLTSAASFFIISNQPKSDTVACVKDCWPVAFPESIASAIDDFLHRNELKLADMDCVFYAAFTQEQGGELAELFTTAGISAQKCIDYLAFSGVYPTASAFAMHYAADLMKADKTVRNALIVNGLRSGNLGLTLIQSVEA